MFSVSRELALWWRVLPFYHIYANAEVMMLAIHIDACQALMLSWNLMRMWSKKHMHGCSLWKKKFFSAFCSKCCFKLLIKKRMHEARIKLFCCCLKADAQFFILSYCMFRFSYNRIFWGLLHFCENDQKCWLWLATFYAGRERVKFDCCNVM